MDTTTDSRPGLTYDRRRLNATATELGLDLIVAFGSRVSGDPPPTLHSDLDVAVLDRQSYTWQRFQEVYGPLGDVFRRYDLDLAFLTQADPLFRFQIFRTAERLFGSSLLFCEQQCYAKTGYFDSGDLRDLEHTLFEHKMAHIDRVLDGWRMEKESTTRRNDSPDS